MRRFPTEELSSLINNYLTKLDLAEKQVQNMLLQTQMTIYEKANLSDREQRAVLYRKFNETTEAQQSVFSMLTSLFAQGYVLVNHLHNYIVGETIEYHIGIERGKTRDSIIYTATEEEVVNKLQIDTYSLAKALLTGEMQSLDYSMRYRATVKSAVENEEHFSLPKNGSTLWSKGYRVFQAVKNYGIGINFGHFLEAYYLSGGNLGNRNVRNFDSVQFYQIMKSAMNSTEFYKGGDVQNIQLKSNTATVTSLQTIKKVLLEILKILSNNKMTNKVKNLRALLKAGGNTKAGVKQKASEIDIPEELLSILRSLDVKS